jgi:hypothetical protein
MTDRREVIFADQAARAALGSPHTFHRGRRTVLGVFGYIHLERPAMLRIGRYRVAATVLAALALVPLLVYATTTAFPRHPAAPTAAGPSPDSSPTFAYVIGSPPTPTGLPTPLPTSTDGFMSLCIDPPGGFPTATPYGGGGPHPTVFFGEVDRDSLPAGWNAANVAQVQLVACIGAGAPGSVIRTCRYQTDNGVRTVRLVHQNYTVKLFEAATAKVVLSTTVPGSSTQCPETVLGLKGHAPGDQASELTTADIVRVLGPFIR